MDQTTIKPAEIGRLSSFSNDDDFEFPTEDDGVKFPRTRKAALQYRDIGANISLTKDMMNNLVIYHQAIGADKDLPTKKKKLYGYLNRFHLHLAVKNDRWPADMSFGFIYGAFLNGIIQSEIPLKGFNVSCHIEAFKKWISHPEVESSLRKAWYEANPQAAPKQLEGREAPEESEETKKIIADGYVDEPPATVKRLIDTLEWMHGSMEAAIEALANKSAKSYRRRLYNTRQKYIDEGKWPEQSEASEPPEHKPE